MPPWSHEWRAGHWLAIAADTLRRTLIRRLAPPSPGREKGDTITPASSARPAPCPPAARLRRPAGRGSHRSARNRGSSWRHCARRSAPGCARRHRSDAPRRTSPPASCCSRPRARPAPSSSRLQARLVVRASTALRASPAMRAILGQRLRAYSGRRPAQLRQRPELSASACTIVDQGRATCRTAGPASHRLLDQRIRPFQRLPVMRRQQAHSAALRADAASTGRARAPRCRATSTSWRRRNSACRCAARSARRSCRRARIRSARSRSRGAGTAGRRRRHGCRWSRRRCASAIAEHSMCQPGRPRPHGESQPGRSSVDGFHSTKSPAIALVRRHFDARAGQHFLRIAARQLAVVRESWRPRTARGLRRRRHGRLSIRRSIIAMICGMWARRFGLARPAAPRRARPCPRGRRRRICR